MFAYTYVSLNISNRQTVKVLKAISKKAQHLSSIFVRLSLKLHALAAQTFHKNIANLCVAYIYVSFNISNLQAVKILKAISKNAQHLSSVFVHLSL